MAAGNIPRVAGSAILRIACKRTMYLQCEEDLEIRRGRDEAEDYVDVWLKFSWWEFCAGRVHPERHFLRLLLLLPLGARRGLLRALLLRFLSLLLPHLLLAAPATSVLGKDQMEPRLHSLCVTAGRTDWSRF